MTSRERFLAGIRGERVDRTPLGSPTSVATVEQMELTGALFPKVHLDGAAMARLAAGAREVLGYDAIMPIFSVTQEAAALGCEMDWGALDIMPVVKTHPFDSKVDAKDAVQAAGRMALVGNVNNTEVLLRGTPDTVAQHARYAVEAGVRVLAPECAIPLRTPLENLKALHRAVRQ